jgi:hypothetical protein
MRERESKRIRLKMMRSAAAAPKKAEAEKLGLGFFRVEQFFFPLSAEVEV